LAAAIATSNVAAPARLRVIHNIVIGVSLRVRTDRKSKVLGREIELREIDTFRDRYDPNSVKSPRKRLSDARPISDHIDSSFPRKREPRASDLTVTLDPRFRGGDDGPRNLIG
jgi:hypothetical protein